MIPNEPGLTLPATYLGKPVTGVLDDRCESWFIHGASPPRTRLEGMESVVNLGLSEEWPPPPQAR